MDSLQDALEILTHRDSIFKLSKNRTDYDILQQLPKEFIDTHEFSY
ncbi:MAG: hypothetical protein PQJ49_12535 [Sphaerochaetaceae bacterium]|nr:hypothetical protein [Sphaerochaetaceae bacterium]